MSSILKIEGNKALLDLTRGEHSERDKENSKYFNTVEKALDYINQNYRKASTNLIDWATEQEDIHEVIKIAYVFYMQEVVTCRVQKLEPEDYETASILFFYDQVALTIEQHPNNDHFKTSDNIDDFNNPDW